MECILHIGIGKAGSSSLQAVFQNSRSILKERGILYPDDLLANGQRGGDNHKCLAVSSMKRNRSNIVLEQHRVKTPQQRAAFDRKVVALYREQLQSNPDDVCLLSAEHFWSCLGTPVEVEKLSNKMAMLGLRVTKLVVYLRRQSDWFDSFQMQRVREGRGLIGQTAEQILATPTATQLDYARLLDTWSEFFPEAEIVPRLFSRSDMVNGDILHDFCDAIGVEPWTTAPSKNASAVSNYGINLMLALRARLDEFPGRGANLMSWRQITDLVEKHFTGNCATLNEEAKQGIDAFYAEGNETVRARYFPGRSELFSSPTARSGKEIFHELDTPELSSSVKFVLDLLLYKTAASPS